MFDINQIKEAHSKVKSGADFTKYVQDLIKLGVASYDTFVNDGHTRYFGEDNFEIESGPKYPYMEVAKDSDNEKFKSYLKTHQQGQSDYATFCKHSAETGVEKWTVDMKQMTCTYYNRSNGKMLVENIPGL